METVEFKYIRFEEPEYLANEVAKIVAKEFGIKFTETKIGPKRKGNHDIRAEGMEYFVDKIRRALNDRVKEFEKLDVYRGKTLCRKESERKTYYANFVVEQVINEDLYKWLCGMADQRTFGTTSKNKYDEIMREAPEIWEFQEYRTDSEDTGEEPEFEILEELRRIKTDIVVDFVYEKYIKNRTMPDITPADIKCILPTESSSLPARNTISKESKASLQAHGITFIPSGECNRTEPTACNTEVNSSIDIAIETVLRQKKLALVVQYVCEQWIEINEELLCHDIGYCMTADSNPGPKHIYKDVLARMNDLSRYYKVRKK